MLKIVINFLLALLLVLSGATQANESEVKKGGATKIAVHIQAQDYTHQIRLWQNFRDYWYTQGPLLEKEAIRELKQEFGETNALMCDSRPIESNILIWLRPRMFYNPQLQRYYGKVIASVYAGDGKPVATYVGEAQKQGLLDIYPDRDLALVYQSSMQALIKNMKADTQFQNAMNNKAFLNPCAIVNLLPEPKIQFMSF
jgi:hypothetical protein